MNKKSIFSKIIKYNNYETAINNIRKKGEKAPGIDRTTLKKFLTKENPYQTILNRLKNFKPNGVRRVDIPKDNGTTRPLGIPTIEDKIIQMMFKNILEPLCEKKFYKHSYGFRPNRKVEHAIARNSYLINQGKLYFCVDIDIKGFFDNVNHTKLIKQCISLGITDMKVLSVIKAMLKAPIYHPNGDIEIPTKGTPQGGILSPLLSNICLNELDWWIAKQWHKLVTNTQYTKSYNKYRAIKDTNLSEVWLVRYADDFKLLCRDRGSAEKMFKITKQFLKNRLKLDISKKKSKIVNLKKQKSEFLGLSIKANLKGKNGKRVAHSYMSEKSKKKCFTKLKETIKSIQRGGNTVKKVLLYNSQVRGIQNYYQIATHISLDLRDIGYLIDKIIWNRLKTIGKYGSKDSRYKERFRGYNHKCMNIAGISIFTIQAQKHKNPMHYSEKNINKKLTKQQVLKKNINTLYEKLIHHNVSDTSWNLLRIKAYQNAKGICYVTDTFISFNEFAVHHIIPREFDGKDVIENLVILKKDIHIELHKKETNFNNLKFDKLRKKILNCLKKSK